MADDVSLELWMDRRRLAALERVLKESGTDTQAVMQARFDELYRQYVPAQERTAINERIEGERLAAERRAEEARRVCAFHVTEDGRSRYFSVDNTFEAHPIWSWSMRCGNKTFHMTRISYGIKIWSREFWRIHAIPDKITILGLSNRNFYSALVQNARQRKDHHKKQKHKKCSESYAAEI